MRAESIRPETRWAEDENRRPALRLDRRQPAGWVPIAIFSALLIPCFWQSRIQSADLGSHIYNAWLAAQIHGGTIHGLRIASQSNNILFDLLLEGLLTRVGANAAQAIAVALCVLIFTTGAIAFVSRLGGRANWWLTVPSVAMLAYGFIFHIGFFNFYLSMGLSLWSLALLWSKGWGRSVLALPLLVVAWTAHPLPVVWGLGIAAYVAAARMLPERKRIHLLAAGLIALVVIQEVLARRYVCGWSARQIFYVTGANQLAVFGPEYSIPFAGLLFVWLRQLRKLIKSRGIGSTLSSLPFQLWILSAAAVVLIPNQIMFPQFGLPFQFITTRLSLAAGLILCSALAAAPLARVDKATMLAVTAIFFALLYHDQSSLNRLEQRVDAVVAELPAMQRVIATAPERSLRWLCFLHDVERECIGRCWSYANYEPSSRQFRVRAEANNGIVMSDFADVNAVQLGTYVVQPRDLPLYSIYPCGAKREDVCTRALAAGEISGAR